jgi:16S rRNA (cytosine1402-N4)-methyltransferase
MKCSTRFALAQATWRSTAHSAAAGTRSGDPERIQPGGRLLGLDSDPIELPHTEARVRAAGFGAGTFVARHGNFADVAGVLAADGLAAVDMILADLGVSSMQADTPERVFSYKEAGPLDMRMIRHGELASGLLARLGEEQLASLLTENADEPHARLIAGMLKRTPAATTTHAVERLVRTGLSAALPALAKTDVKMSVRRTFQALRIAVNDEFSALDALLRSLPECLAPGGRVVVMTFHSGEDRRVKNVQGRLARRVFGRCERGRSLHEGRDIREPARIGGQATLGCPRASPYRLISR